MADEKKIIEIKVELTDGIKEIGRLVGMIDTLNKAQKDNKRTTEEQRTEYAANSVALREYRAQLSTMVRETRNEIKTTNEKLGYIQQLKAQVSNLTLEYERLSQAELQGSKGGEVLTLLKNKREELSKLEQAYGNYSRNVGNYSSATNQLALNLGMVMKEIPNFALSARIGIMSLTNNLPMLAEAIKAVRVEQKMMAEQGKAVPSMFSLITKSVFGLTGIVSTAMVLVQIFGADIIEWAKNAIIGETAADRYAKGIERINMQYERSKLLMDEQVELMRVKGATDSEIIKEQIKLENQRWIENEGRELAGLKNDVTIGKKLNKQRKERLEELRKLEQEHFETTQKLGIKYNTALTKEDIKAEEERIKNTEKAAQDRLKIIKDSFDKQYESYKELEAILNDIQQSQYEVSSELLKKGEKDIDAFLESITKKRVYLTKSLDDQLKQQAEEDSVRWDEEQRRPVEQGLFNAQLELDTAEARGQSTLNQQMALLDAQRNAELNNARLTNDELQRIEEYYAAKRQEIKRQELNSALSATGDMFGAVAALFEENTTEYKVFATAQALMNTYLGITNALAQTKGGIFAQIAGTIAAAATGFAAVRNIWKVKTDGSQTSAASGVSGGTGASAAKLPPDTTSKMATPLTGYVSPTGVNGGSAAITSGAATSISTGSSDVLRALANLPQPIVTVKDIDIATKRVQVVDKLNRV